MFAVQHGGWCAASATAAKTFDKYGKSTSCKDDGEGGPWGNQVYVIKGKVAFGYTPDIIKMRDISQYEVLTVAKHLKSDFPSYKSRLYVNDWVHHQISDRKVNSRTIFVNSH